MNGEGGRSAHLARILLLLSLVTVNAALIALNLDKHQLLWFQSRSTDDRSGITDQTAEQEPAGAEDGISSTDAVAAAPVTPVSPDPNDPFQGRGGVPNGPPEPRQVLLRSDGTAEIVGSAPSGVVADAIADTVLNRLSPRVESIDQRLTWHPAAPNQTAGGAVALDPALVYPSGEVAVPLESTDDLDFAASVMAARPEAFVVVTGYIDDLGESEENVAVASARVSAVVGQLESHGVEGGRIVSAVAPVSADPPPNETGDERAFNRRVEIRFENLLGLQPTVPPSAAAASADVLWSVDSALVAGSDCAAPVEGEALRVAYAADFSPLGAATDVAGSEAVGHLAKLINCSGGVRGRPVEVAVFDVGGGRDAARQSIGELLAWQPVAVIGPRLAGPGLRLVEALDRRVPVVFAGATEPALADATRGSFLAASDGGRLADVAATFAIDNGWRSAVTFTSPGPDFGFDPAAFAVGLATDGGVVLADFGFSARAPVEESRVVFAEAMAQLGAGPAPDVILASMPTEHLVALRQEAAAAGVETAWITTNPMAPMASTESTAGAPAADSLPGSRPGDAELDPEAAAVADVDDLAGLHVVGSVAPDPDGRAARLDRSFRDATGFNSTNPTAATLAADALVVIIEAYLRGGGGTGAADGGQADAAIDAATISRALAAGLVIEGVGGRINYSGGGGPSRTVHVLQLVDGTMELVSSFDP